MKKQLINLFCLVLLAGATFSCKDEYDDNNLDPLAPSYANIPVTVTNANFFERYPIITTSLAAGGSFTINFEIPADKGIIKEISRVTTSPSGAVNFTNLNQASAGTALNVTGAGTAASPFVLAPIPGNGTNQISFTSTVRDYLNYRFRNNANFGPLATAGTPAVAVMPLALPAAAAPNAPVEIQYYFRLTLEDGTSIIAPPVRVRPLP